MVKASSFEASQKKTRTSSAIESELNAVRKMGDEAEAALSSLIGERDAMPFDASDEKILALENKIDVQRSRIGRIARQIKLLTDELDSAGRDEIGAVLAARAEEIRKMHEANRGAALRRLNEAYAAAAAALAEINQFNGEAQAINPHLPAGCEPIPVLDIRITHVPGHTSLVAWLTSQFPILGFDQPVAVSWPGAAGYPAAVKEALAKAVLEKSAATRAALAAQAEERSARANTPGKLATFTRSPRAPDPASPEPAPAFRSGKR
jgi:hypothetical protein